MKQTRFWQRLRVVVVTLSAIFLIQVCVPMRTQIWQTSPVLGQSLQSSYCECVQYILNRYNGGTPLNNPDGRYSDAYKLDQPDPDGRIWMELIAGGSFHRVSTPQSGGILVLQRGVAGMSSRSGHIAVVESVQNNGGTWIILMRGANQGGNLFGENNCGNVSLVTITLSKNEQGVSYWSQGSQTDPGNPPDPGTDPTPQPEPTPVPCPDLVMRAPDDGQILQDHTVTFRWQPPEGECSNQPVILRIKDTPNIDSGGFTILEKRLEHWDESYTHIFDETWVGKDLYWSVWSERTGTNRKPRRSFKVSPNAPPVITFDSANGDAFPSGSILSNNPDWIFAGTARDPEGKLQPVTWFCSATGYCGEGIDTAKSNGDRWSLQRTNMAGENVIYFIARDDKHRVVSRALTLRIDRKPPVTTLSLNGEANASRWPEWFNKPVQVRLQAIDGNTGTVRAGVGQIHFRLDGGGWQIRPVTDTTFTVQGDGTHTIEYYAVDTVGNAEKARTISLKIDTMPPSAISGLVETHNIPNNVWNDRNVATFEWAASTDNGSGLAGYQLVFVNLSNGIVVNQSFTASEARRWTPYGTGFVSGEYVLRGQALDRAGNASGWKDLYIIKYDNTPPVNPSNVLHQSGVLSGQPQNQTRNADFTWTTPFDLGSGADGCYLVWGLESDGVGGPDSYTRQNSYLNTAPICGADDRCTGYFRMRCQDKAGNLAPAWTTVFQLVYRPFLDPESKNYRLTGWGVSVGAGQSTTSNFQLNSTVGQIADAAVMTGNRYRLASGYQATRAQSLATLASQPEHQASTPDTCLIPRISINADALATNTTNVTLSLCATGAERMRISNDPNLTGAPWESFVPTRDWTITDTDPVTEPRFVYAAFQYPDGTVLQTYMDDIIYDPTPPMGQIAADASAPGTLALTAQDEGSGVTQLQISPDADFSDATWETYTSTLHIAPGPERAASTQYIRFRDDASNISEPVNIDIDMQPPTGSITLDPSALGPHQDFTTLTLTAQDNLNTELDMRISEDVAFAESVWQPFTPTLTLPLAPANENWGVVYVQYRDQAGNLSVIYGALYGVDTSLPEITAAWLTPGDSLTRTLTVQARDLFTGVAWLHLSSDPLMLEGLVTLPYTQTVTWTLDEREVVWIQVEDGVGNRSLPYPVTTVQASDE